ncbi:MAG: hypothetical protein N2745_08685 [Syntrophorhabdaceae bacterium]|nr:hypothetical protein [Syntrophorhabdaceae bacterium]
MEEIRKEIKKIEESALRLKSLAPENNSIVKNASIILVFVYLLKFATAMWEE